MTPNQGFAEEYSTLPTAAAISDIVSRVQKLARNNGTLSIKRNRAHLAHPSHLA
jgi:hypothetical protein